MDDKIYTGAVLADLSKAFDCLPHCLLILSAFGVNANSCRLRVILPIGPQRVHIGDNVSEWLPLTKGAPQGSLMGPFVYNIHVFNNDLLLQVTRNGDGNMLMITRYCL